MKYYVKQNAPSVTRASHSIIRNERGKCIATIVLWAQWTLGIATKRFFTHKSFFLQVSLLAVTTPKFHF